jgi:hypothetical protein
MAIQPLAIQFAARRSSIGWPSLLALAIAALCLCGSLWNYGVARAELEGIEDNIGAATASVERRKAVPNARPAVTIPDSQILAINAAIGQLNLPWAELFQAFEAAKPDTVALIALEPDGKKRALIVQAEARNPEQMIAFAERLKQLPMFEEAFLTKHEIREQDPNRPYRFTLDLRWREDV